LQGGGHLFVLLPNLYEIRRYKMAKEDFGSLEETQGGPGITIKRQQQPNLTYLKDTENLKSKFDNLESQIKNLRIEVKKNIEEIRNHKDKFDELEYEINKIKETLPSQKATDK